MFPLLGKIVVRYWYVLLVLWVAALAAGRFLAPRWEDVTSNSEVQFLPEDAASRLADKLFKESYFDFSPGNVALVFARQTGELTEADRDFIRNDVRGKPADKDKGTAATGLWKVQEDVIAQYAKNIDDAPINKILTLDVEGVGSLLVSLDKKATVVLVEVKPPFQDSRNVDIVRRIERMLKQLRIENKVPEGLEVGIAGSATAGRDLDKAEEEGAKAIERWTIAIVVVLLVLLYRAPLVALIPLLTVFVAVETAMPLLAALAQKRDFVLFGRPFVFSPARDLRVFVTVLAYGAGVDYCLFLVARYREELDRGKAPGEALEYAIGQVGGAITASAAVVIGGIGMLAFARFGKLRDAGLVIPLALSVALLGTMTFAAALLRLAGPWAFWPAHVADKHAAGNETKSAWRWLVDSAALPNVWDRIGPFLVRRAGLVFLLANLALAPFVVVGVLHSHDQNFNPLSDLPATAPSRVGMGILTKHFDPGVLGPVVVLVENKKIDFSDKATAPLVRKITDTLHAEMSRLHLSDVRTLVEPLGYSEVAQAKWATVRDRKDLEEDIRAKALGVYVGEKTPHVLRIDLTLDEDPLSLTSLGKFAKLREEFRKLLPAELQDSRIEFGGPTASLHDLAVIKQGDQDLIQILVSAIVFVMLLIVLRRGVVSVYLVLSVLLSYIATLGMTDLLFRWLIGPEFAGLDWKVPIFLFTILVAVGEDYNIFLLTRVKEEQDAHGPMGAIPYALSKTGQVISACGFVMAGTFASLLSGSLLAMKELGFALAIGVLIDTLIVRPILVPTFLVLLQRMFPGPLGEYMALGRWKSRPTGIG